MMNKCSETFGNNASEFYFKIALNKETKRAKEVEERLKESQATGLEILQNSETGIATINLLNYKKEIIDSKTIDVGVSAQIVNISLDYDNAKLIFLMSDGTTLECSINELISTIDTKVSKPDNPEDGKLYVYSYSVTEGFKWIAINNLVVID